MNDHDRDDVVHAQDIARALRDLPIPEHRPSFWAELDEALAAGPAGAAADPADPPLHRLDTGELPTVTALAEGRARRSRRSPILAAAAALVILAGAVGAVLVVGGDDDGGDDDEAELADGPTATTTAASTFEAEPTTTVTEISTTTLGAEPGSASDTVLAWLTALGSGDVEAAAALTGPRTTAYLEATTDGVDAFLRESAEGYGAWVGAPDVQVEEVKLGRLEPVDGELTIVIVSGTNPGEGREGPTTDVFPVVDTGDGWRVEHQAFDPTRDRNIPIIQIPRAPTGVSGLGSMAPDEAVEVIVPAAGTVIFRLDDEPPFTRETTGVGANDDPYARFDPSGSLTPGEHELIVVGVGADGTIAWSDGTFTVTR